MTESPPKYAWLWFSRAPFLNMFEIASTSYEAFHILTTKVNSRNPGESQALFYNVRPLLIVVVDQL